MRILVLLAWAGNLSVALLYKSGVVNDNHYAMPADEYFKQDQRLTVKNAGRYECEPQPDGKHGDTFVSGEMAEYALMPRAAAFNLEVI